MNRYALTGILATLAAGMVVGAHGCALNPFAGYTFEEAQGVLSGATSSGGGVGGAAGNGGTGGTGGAPCMCTDDGNECTDDMQGACPNDDPLQCHTPRVDQACEIGWCSSEGECKDCQTCTDAEMCKSRCNGVACSVTGECKSQKCEFVDMSVSVCCDKECSGPCESCNRPGLAGTCTPMPRGLSVVNCNPGHLCDGNGECAELPKAALGAACGNDTDCASVDCRAETCRSNINQSCTDDVECGTNLCDPVTKTCKSCILPNGPSCPVGSSCDTTTGECKAALGQPAHKSSECHVGMMNGFLCALPAGSACAQHWECVSRNCVNGTCAGPCTTSSQCIAGTNCVMSTCRLLPGNYCIEDWLCQSGKCSGFPRRCE